MSRMEVHYKIEVLLYEYIIISSIDVVVVIISMSYSSLYVATDR